MAAGCREIVSGVTARNKDWHSERQVSLLICHSRNMPSLPQPRGAELRRRAAPPSATRWLAHSAGSVTTRAKGERHLAALLTAVLIFKMIAVWKCHLRPARRARFFPS